MTNNDILRRLRYTFDFDDATMIAIFAAAGAEVSRAEISNWLKRDDDADYKGLGDKPFGTFLDGFITTRRGKRDGPPPPPEPTLGNNRVFAKLKIALNLRGEDVMEILALADFRLSNHELSAFFRKPTHKHYRVCKDQVLRNFLQGLQAKHRPGGGP